MKHLLNSFYLLSFLIICLETNAQYYTSGQDRASLKWKQIRTINFNVIFPEGYETQGEHVAKLLEKSYEYVSFSLNHKPKKVSVVLHTESSISNASLGWAPSRIEMYTTPPQDIYSQDWLEQISIHEFRHMIQISKIESEMPKLLRFIFGEQAAALLTGMYLPFWFIEGDAVAAETGLSKSGRGRVPDFQKTIKAQLVDKGKFKYDKAYLGSYKDKIADYYELGYLLVAGARKKFGNLVWDKVVSNVARTPFSLNAFEKGLKKSTGLGKVALYDTIFNDLKKQWIKEDQNIVPTYNEIISPENYYFTDYKYSALLEDGTFFTVKSGISEVTSFVSILPDGNEKKLFTPGYIFNESVSAKDNFIVWSEYTSHLRWYHSSKSIIRLLDINTGKIRDFKTDDNLFAPVISKNNQKLLAVETDDKYRFSLIIIDIDSGNLIKRINTKDNSFFITPSWSEKDGKVISVMMFQNRKCIAEIDTETETIEMIVDFGNHEIKRPKEHGDLIYFIGGFTGTDNLYAFNKEDKSVYTILNSRFGIFDYDFAGNSIIYNDYSSEGFRLVQTPFDSISYEIFEIKNIPEPFPLADNLNLQEGNIIDFQNLDNITYLPEKYFKPAHLLNFHSWAPISIDPSNNTAYPGVSFMSQNMLGTAETILGYRYKWEENKGEVYANYKYTGWYPVIETEINYGKSKSSYTNLKQYYNNEGQIVRVDTIEKKFTWDETNLNINTYIPLDLSKGNKYRLIYPYVNYQLTNYQKDADAYKDFPDGISHSLEAGLYFYNILYSSQQDLLPNFGFLLDISYCRSLSDVVNSGSIFSVSNTFYFPGLFKNHGIKLYNGYQNKITGDYYFSDKIRFPRGHMSEPNYYLYSMGIDYMMPLFYPDLRIGKLVYFKRIKMALFYDHALLGKITTDNGNILYTKDELRSAGIELTADTNFFRFIFPFEVGFRTSYLFDKNFDFDFMFDVQFSF